MIPFSALNLIHRHARAAARYAVVLPLVLAPWALAQTKPQSEPVAKAERGRTDAAPFTIALSQLTGDDKPVRLAGVASSMKLSLPLPALMQAQEVRLELSGTASRALTAVSQLEVAVNGRVIRQLGLGGGREDFRQSITIPQSVLRDGFNEVRLTAAQHYTDRCEYPMASQLWTDIHLRDSQFVISAVPKSVPATLDRLAALFDKAVFADAPPVGVFTAQTPDGAVLRAAGLVAQGVGHRYDYVPVRMTSARFPAQLAQLGAALPAQARVGVVLGTFDQLASYLQGLAVPTDVGPVVAVRALPQNPGRYVVILAAATEADLPVAATAFALQRMPWPERPWVAVRDLQLPAQQELQEAADIQDSLTQAQPLRALGYTTATYSGLPTGSATLRFWNSSWQGRVQLRLHLNYSSGMAEQSALNVLANGVMHGSIPLNNPLGGIYTSYVVTVPTGALRVGWNTLELQPVLVPQTNGGECKPFFLGNLATTIYDDSTLQNFGGSPLTRPDLGLIARDGRNPQVAPLGEGMAVQLTDAEDATVGAGLTLMAKLTQVLRTSLVRASFQVGPDKKATNRLWVGAKERLPDQVRQRTRLDHADRLVLNVPLMQTVKVPVMQGSNTLSQLQATIQPPPKLPLVLAARVTLDDAPAPHAIAATAFDDGHPLTVFTANTPADLQAGLHDVISYGQWARLHGGLAFWRPGEPVRSLVPEDMPFSAYTLRGSLGLLISQYPWWSLALVLSLIGALVGLTRLVLAQYRRRNLPAQPPRTSEKTP